MTSPAERSINVAAIRFQIQSLYSWTQQNRHVVTGTFSFFAHSAGTGLQGKVFELS